MKLSFRRPNEEQVDIIVEKTPDDGFDFHRIELSKLRAFLEGLYDLLNRSVESQNKIEDAKFAKDGEINPSVADLQTPLQPPAPVQ